MGICNRMVAPILILLREDAHKKNVFFSVQTTKALPSLHQWLSGPCHFFPLFFSLIIT